jgi:hypothetical protein
MNPQEYQKLKQKFEKEKDEAYVALKTAEGKLAGLEETYKQLGCNKPAKHKDRKSKRDKSQYAYDPSQDVNKTDILRKSLANLGDTFKTKNFITYLRENYPEVKFNDTFVSNTPGKFIKQGLVVVDSKGERKKGYVYRRKTG